MSLDFREMVEKEKDHENLTSVRDNLYEVARDYLRHLRRERDEHDNPHTKEAQRANDKYHKTRAEFDRLRAVRQRKINVVIFSPGDMPKQVRENLTDAERDYVEMVSEADGELRRACVDDESVGMPVKEVSK